ncbi:MAG: PD-(D/E)XK nuclease family protein [Candidatus Eisenbacteria bacterium]
MPPRDNRIVLLTGRAGSGKTSRIADLFLSRGGETPGRGALLLLPDRGAAREFRVRFLGQSKPQGFLDGGITTFEDYAASLLGVARDETAAPEEESLLLRAIASELPGPLAGRARSVRFRGALLRWVSDLRGLGIRGPEIRAMSDALPQPDARLRLLADAYDLLLHAEEESGLLFREDLPRRASRSIEEGSLPFHPPELLLVDGFHHFSGARLELLSAVARRTPEVFLTLPSADPDDPWMGKMLERSHSALVETLAPVDEALPGGDRPIAPVFLGGTDRREEIERIAREILRACHDAGRKPGDFLLLFRDIEPYRSVIEDVFRRFRIPFRARFQAGAASTPPGRSLLDCLRVAREGATRETVDAWVKNRMFDVDADIGDRTIASWHATPEPPDGESLLAEVAALDRGFATERVEPLVRLAREARESRGGNVIRAVRDAWLEWIDLSLRESAFPEEDLPLAGASVSRLADLLDRLASLFDREERFRDAPVDLILDLAREEIGRARVSYAAGGFAGVRVDDFRHGQNLRAPVVFVAGLEAGLSPRPYDPGSFWNEGDRERLNASGQLRVPDRSLHADEERFLFRRACERGTEALYLTAPAFQPGGKPCPESPFRQEVRREWEGRGRVDRGAAERFESAEGIAAVADVLPFLASRADPAERDEAGIRLAAALLARAKVAPPDPPRSFRDPVAMGKVRAFRAWLRPRNEWSVTELEDFQACPYRYLAKHVFRLREPEESAEHALPVVLEGMVLHRVLEEAGPDDLDVKEIVARAFEEARGCFPERVGHRLAEEELRENLASLLEDDFAFRRDHGWTPHAFEFRFGTKAKRPVRVAGGLRVRGRIDRVDFSLGGRVLVVDYKRSARGGRAALERGLREERSLALPLYTLAAAELSARRPAGAFLLAVREGRRVGFFDASLAGEGIVPSGKDARGSTALGEEEFAGRLRRAGEIAREAADGIRRGDFPVEPADDKVCDSLSCPYRDLCRVVLAAREEGEEVEEE